MTAQDFRPKEKNDLTCHAESSRGAALIWTTLAFFAGFAGVSAFGPVAGSLKESMHIDPILMGLLASSPALTGSLLRIPFGAMVDRTGGKKPVTILLVLSLAGVAGITFLFALFERPEAAQYPLFLMAGILCGCGIAVFSVGVPTVSYWYPRRRQGTALAVYAGIGNLGPGLFALILPALVVALGFTVSYLLWCGLLMALLLLVALFMKDAPSFQYQAMGRAVDQETLRDACGQEMFPSGRAFASVKAAAQSWRTWSLTYFYFISFGGFIALTVWFPTYWSENFGISIVYAGFLTALYSLSASLLRVLGGLAADRLGGEKVIWGSFGGIAAGALLLAAASGSLGMAVTGTLAMALSMGFANAAVFKLVPVYSPEAVGGAAGIVGGLGAFGGFVIPPVMGLFVTYAGTAGYAWGFSVFVLLASLAFILLWFMRS